jgi:hypothetical protein
MGHCDDTRSGRPVIRLRIADDTHTLDGMTTPRRERRTDWPLTIVAVVAASFAARFAERLKTAQACQDQTQRDVDTIRCELESLRAELASNGTSELAKQASDAAKVRSRRRTDFTAARLHEK